MIWHQTTWQDFRYALRGMRLNPGFSLTAILSLALGLGASLSIFTVVDNLCQPGAPRALIPWKPFVPNDL